MKPTPSRRLWVVAPGSKASEWQTFYDAGIIGIGWENLTDLREYKDKEAIRKKLQESEGDSSKVNDTLACWQFAHVMRPGDILFAKKGLKKVVGYGTVTGTTSTIRAVVGTNTSAPFNGSRTAYGISQRASSYQPRP